MIVFLKCNDSKIQQQMKLEMAKKKEEKRDANSKVSLHFVLNSDNRQSHLHVHSKT